MISIFSDTTFEAEQVQIELLRQAPSWRKFEMVAQMNQTVRLLMQEGLRQRFPNASEGEIRRRLADLILGPELGARIFGPLDST